MSRSGITNKQKKMADTYLTEPVTKTAAYRANYDVRPETKPASVHRAAEREFKKPTVLAYLAQQSDKLERDLLELVETTKRYSKEGGNAGAAYAAVNERTINSVLDRVHGKAKQSIEVQSQHVSLSLDLTGTIGELPKPQPN